jgi:hypothetical protein
MSVYRLAAIMLVPNNLEAIIQGHRAKQLTSLCETSRRHLDGNPSLKAQEDTIIDLLPSTGLPLRLKVGCALVR